MTGAAALLLATPALAAAPDLSGLSWLFGRWVAVGGGAEKGRGGFSFAPEVGGQVVVRRNRADYPARRGRPAEHHKDLMVIWRERGVARATYWDSEGQVIRYFLDFPAAGEVVFLSDDSNSIGPRFRLSYHRTSARKLAGEFEIATDEDPVFRPYLKWVAVRVGAP